MKTIKKLGIGLTLLSVIILAAAFLLPAKDVAAATFTRADVTGATYKFLDGANISAKFNSITEPVIFTDVNINTNPRNFVPLSSSDLCDPGDVANQSGISGNIRYGINIDSGADLTKATVPAQIKIDYLVGGNCNKANAVLANITINNPSQAASTDFQWDGAQIKSLNGSSNSQKLDLVPNTDNLLYTEFGKDCGSGSVILLDQANGNTGKLYTVVPAGRVGGLGNLGNYPAIAKYFTAGTCHVNTGPIAVTIAGKAGQAASGGAGTTQAVGDSCELDSGGFSLSWLFCPLLTAANDLVNGSGGNGGLIGLFEDQLSFNVNRDLGVVGGGDNQVQTAWSLIKNISTALLIIVMLLMIFSQAISAGPFDAYTVRKLLPRLVAAVILMQLSWYIVAWAVDLVDAIGHSLTDLLYAPFGGSDNLNLGGLLAHAHISAVEAGVISWVGLVAIIGVGLAALPTVLFMVFAAIVALFTALVVLIFRKIIIIMCLIFAPLAILAWILPGTQRYWKLWLDNFTKVLLMFPLVVMLVAAGHIFAYIIGTQGNGTFLNMIFIMVGVFGPLFLIPKTFKWGGQALSLAGGAINSVGARVQKGGQEPIKNFGQRIQGSGAKKYNPEGGFKSRTFRRIQSGHAIPFSKRSQRLAIAAGDAYSAENDEQAQALIKRKGEKAMADGVVITKRNDRGEALSATRFKLNANGKKYDEDGVETDDDDKAVREVANVGEEVATQRLDGIAAMKQKWVDLAENGRDENERKMAIRQLTATSSWPEIQGAFTESGKRVTDTDAWMAAVSTSQEDYPKVLRSRVDAAPHIIDSANNALIKENEDRAARNEDPLSNLEAREFKSAHRINTAISKQMSNEDFSTQSDGFWAEAARMANQKNEDGSYTKEAQAIRTNLQARLESIQQIGGTAPQQLLGHLANGGKLEANVNSILGEIKLKDYIRSGTGPAIGRVAVSPTNATPGSTTGAPAEVEVEQVIDHGQAPAGGATPGQTIPPAQGGGRTNWTPDEQLPPGQNDKGAL